MALIRDKKTGSNVSVAAVNGYTVEKVRKAEKYLREIGSNQRSFPLERLVEMYNDIKGTNDRVPSCRCQSAKYFMGLQNYVTYGKLTLASMGIDIDRIEEEVKESDLTYKEQEEVLSDVFNKEEQEDKPKMSVKERLEKARASRKFNKKNVSDSE